LVANGRKVKMTSAGRDDVFQYYRADLPWDRHSDVSYGFELHDGSTVAYFGQNGYSASPSEPFNLVAKTFHPFVVPDWVNRAVLYQIFPDRFADGDPTNDPPGVQPATAKPTFSNRFGGDTAGVLQHVDYLKDLGIRGIYFNPVFESRSNHRYDATSYLKIDPQFGTNREFDEMTETLQRNGIRTVMDFAFNHTATDFFAFTDILKNQAASSYLPWYFIKSFPVEPRENPPYEAYGGFASMPKVNTVNPDTEKYLLGVADYWIKHAALSGVRLDDATEVDSKFWRDLRSHVKGEKPDVWIVGEEWGDASPWLHGDQWDSTMGYQFRTACLDFFADGKTKPSEFLGQLSTIYGSYPPQVARTLMNLIGSHDTARFLTLCHGDKNLLKLAATVQLTWPGTPCIYYGDEIGMSGGPDPDDRRMMDWPSATRSNDVLNYYKTVISARNHCPALQSGDPEILTEDDSQGTFSYARTLGSDAAVVAVNASHSPRTVSITLPSGESFHSLRANAFDVLTGRRYPSAGTISLSLPPLGAALLLPRENLDSSLLQGALGAKGQISSGHSCPFSSQGAL
jgi:cyclomaltodextrinase